MTSGQAEKSSVLTASRCHEARRPGWRQSSLIIGALLVFLNAKAVVAGANPFGRILAPSGGAVVTAGELVDVRWTALARDVEEFELLLSLDDGRHFSLRLTVMLNPRLRTYSWRVPNLPTETARIRLRVGREGRETEAEIGEAFRIVGAKDAVVAQPSFRDGELWMTPDAALWLRELDVPRTRIDSADPVEWAENLVSEGSRWNAGEVRPVQHRADPVVCRASAGPRKSPRQARPAIDLPQRE